jgi:hypothetical protein
MSQKNLALITIINNLKLLWICCKKFLKKLQKSRNKYYEKGLKFKMAMPIADIEEGTDGYITWIWYLSMCDYFCQQDTIGPDV